MTFTTKEDKESLVKIRLIKQVLFADRAAQRVYSNMYMTGGLGLTFFMKPQKINTKEYQTQKNYSIKVTDPKISPLCSLGDSLKLKCHMSDEL